MNKRRQNLTNCLGTLRIDVISVDRQDTKRVHECKARPLSSRPQERALEPVKEDDSEKLDQINTPGFTQFGEEL